MEYGYNDLGNFPSADVAREDTIRALEFIHKEFCADILTKIREAMYRCQTSTWIENKDHRISPSHFILQEFEQKMKEKGYGVEIETKGSTGYLYVKGVTIDWQIKESVDE